MTVRSWFDCHSRPVRVLCVLALASVCLFYMAGIPVADADTAAELQSKIDTHNQDIQSLQKEIAAYQQQISSLGNQATSLSSTIKSLTLTRKKLETSIALTQKQIEERQLEIQELALQISGKEDDIVDDRRIIAKAFTGINEAGDTSVAGALITSRSLSAALGSMSELILLQHGLYDRIHAVRAAETDLLTNKAAREKAAEDLSSLNAKLTSQRKAVLATAKEQSALLKSTNQSEASYKKILAQKESQKNLLEQEILTYESQLHVSLNTALIPQPAAGVLKWPLDVIRITQKFGTTDFSRAHAQVYNGMGHNGVDFAASIGTPVKAALDGTVVGMGNTDLYPGCYSFGQWIMLKHDNGLSTLYGHLSVENVSIGARVATGDVIGYSGNTGYTTGPHLHFGVYATQGVEIKLFTNSRNCKGATIPIADLKAYLDPLIYL